MRIAALLLSLIFASASAAQQLPIVEEHTPIAIDHAAGERIVVSYFDMAAERHKFLDERHFYRGEGVTIWVAPPGNYVVYGGKEPTIVDILASDDDPPRPEPRPQPDPEPEPNPEPEPEPGPEPVVAKWVVFLEEKDDRAKYPEKVAVMTSPEVTQAIVDKGLKTIICDDDSDCGKSYLDLVEIDLPAVIFISEGGKDCLVKPVPETVEEFKNLLNRSVLR